MKAVSAVKRAADTSKPRAYSFSEFAGPDLPETLGFWAQNRPRVPIFCGTPETWRKAFEQFEGRPANEADLAAHRAGWQQRRWLALEPWLAPEQQAQLNALNDEYGVDEHPEFNTFVTVGFGPIEMPYASEDLGRMSVRELLELFASWEPSGEGLAARPDALGMAVEQAVRDAPDQWAARAHDLAPTPPRYRQALFSGFASAAAMGQPFDLAGLLNLVAAHLADGPPNVADDDGRRSGRRAIADLLRWVLVVGRVPVDEHAERIWELIRLLVVDEETEAIDPAGLPEWSPSERQLPLDTVRSLAFRAAIAYGRRLAPTGARERELRDVLEAGLDPEREPSLAVRAKIASQLPDLVRLDKEWTRALLAPMLAGEPEYLAEVGWSAVLDLKPIPVTIVELLLEAGSYDWGLDHIAGDSRFSQERRERLGRHLVGAAVFSLNGYASPWLRWHELEEGQVRARVVEAIGHELGLRGAPELAAALASRWRERLEALTDGDPELAGYGSWFGADLLAPEAGAELLAQTLRGSGGAVSNMRGVLEAMTSATAGAPLVVIEALRLIADGPVAGQLGWHDRLLRDVIAALAATDEPTVADALQQLIDALAERGLGDFRPGEDM